MGSSTAHLIDRGSRGPRSASRTRARSRIRRRLAVHDVADGNLLRTVRRGATCPHVTPPPLTLPSPRSCIGGSEVVGRSLGTSMEYHHPALGSAPAAHVRQTSPADRRRASPYTAAADSSHVRSVGFCSQNRPPVPMSHSVVSERTATPVPSVLSSLDPSPFRVVRVVLTARVGCDLDSDFRPCVVSVTPCGGDDDGVILDMRPESPVRPVCTASYHERGHAPPTSTPRAEMRDEAGFRRESGIRDIPQPLPADGCAPPRHEMCSPPSPIDEIPSRVGDDEIRPALSPRSPAEISIPCCAGALSLIGGEGGVDVDTIHGCVGVVAPSPPASGRLGVRRG